MTPLFRARACVGWSSGATRPRQRVLLSSIRRCALYYYASVHTSPCLEKQVRACACKYVCNVCMFIVPQIERDRRDLQDYAVKYFNDPEETALSTCAEFAGVCTVKWGRRVCWCLYWAGGCREFGMVEKARRWGEMEAYSTAGRTHPPPHTHTHTHKHKHTHSHHFTAYTHTHMHTYINTHARTHTCMRADDFVSEYAKSFKGEKGEAEAYCYFFKEEGNLASLRKVGLKKKKVKPGCLCVCVPVCLCVCGGGEDKNRLCLSACVYACLRVCV